MSKLNRTFSIEFDVYQKLKEEKNQSELINFLLEKHYSSKKLPEDLHERENNVALRLEETKKKLKELEAVHNQTLSDLDCEKKKQEALEEQAAQDYLNRKQAAVIRIQAQKAYEQHRKDNKLEGTPNNWEEFYADYLKKLKSSLTEH